jgi:lipid-A-disaccharide synthase
MDFYEKFLQNALPNVSIIENKLEHILQKASFAIVTSGTATLETALYKVPQIVCYKSSWISFQIAKRLIKVRYISLVNLIVNQEAVPEMIQDNLTASSLKSEFLKRTKPEAIKATMQMYKALESKLSKEGASKNAAALIQELLTSS